MQDIGIDNESVMFVLQFHGNRYNSNKDWFRFHNDFLDNPFDMNRNNSMILFVYKILNFDKDLFDMDPSVSNMLDLENHLNKGKYNFE
jgi:hypothetical protein